MHVASGFMGPGFWTPAVLSPALILAVIFAFILGWRYLKYLEYRDGVRWRGATAQDAPQVLPPDPAAPMMGASRRGGLAALRGAVTWCAVGVALLLGALIVHGVPVLLLAGLIVLLVGVVRLIFAILES